ncbi:MAG: YfhO family protein [Armatimonadetes bacterium]|nr:YfhO family protein [Armatimonadota bacterium]
MFLWKPIFTGKALLPGDYLAKMSPWNTVIKSPKPEPQWNPLQWDAIAQFYPWRVFYARSMRAGHIPLWNPHQFCGTPFLANGQSAVLYPPNLVFLIFDPITAFTILAALHMFLAASFTYIYLRELGCKELGGIVGGICFAFSAFMVLWLELPTFVAVATWLPLILLLIHRSVERKSMFYAMLAGAVMAMAILAGHFQIAFYLMFAAILWWIWKLVGVWREDGQLYAAVRVGVPLLVFLTLAGLIAAPQIISTQELAMNSHRVRDVTPEGYERFLSNAVPAYRLITAFAPDFFGNPSKNNYFLLGNLNGHIGSAADYMEYGMYIGILPLLLAVVALWQVFKRQHVGFFAVLGLIAILAATGTPINAIFYYLIPGFSALGGPNRILLLYLFSMAALAGFGIDRFNDFANDGLRWRKVLMPLIVAVIITDLFAFGINYNPTCARSKVYPRNKLTDTLKRVAGNSRIAPINPKWSLFRTPNAILPTNSAMVYGLYDVQGYDSLYTKTYKDLSSQVQGQDSSPPENGNMVLMRGYSPTIGRIARYVVAGEAIGGPNARLIEAMDGVRVYELGGTSHTPPVSKLYQPFSFRFGLFLMLVGISSLVLVGVYRAMKYNSLNR